MNFKTALVITALASAFNLANAADDTSLDVTYSTGDTSISVSKNSTTASTDDHHHHPGPEPRKFDEHPPKDFAHEPPHDGKGPSHHDGKAPQHPDGKGAPHNLNGKAPAPHDGKAPDGHHNDLHKKDVAKMKDGAHDKHVENHAKEQKHVNQIGKAEASNMHKDFHKKG